MSPYFLYNIMYGEVAYTLLLASLLTVDYSVMTSWVNIIVKLLRMRALVWDIIEVV